LPKVSVITAAYNHARFISESVESAQSQTYRDFEHIVVDDGSTDNTTEVLQPFQNRIRYLHQENQGVHAALNTGMRAATGDYIALLDSDDVWLPNKLERQMRALEEEPDAGLAYCLAQVIDAAGEVKTDREVLGRPVSNPRDAYAELLRDNPVPALTAVFRRDCLHEVGFFNSDFKAMTDWDLWIRIADHWPIVFVPEVLASYREHESNTWHLMVQNGRVERERLMLLKNASKSARRTRHAEKRAIVNSVFRELALKTAYGHWYRHRYAEAIRYALFALRLRPALVKDALLAIRPRFIPRLVVGERVK